MANICDMRVVFYIDENNMEQVKGLKKLHTTLSDMVNSDNTPFSFILPEEKYSCGDFCYVEDLEGDRFVVAAETAWSPTYDFFDKLSEKYGVRYASSSSESGFDIFEIYGDKEGSIFSHNFSVDIWGEDSDEDAPSIPEGYEFFTTEQELIDWLEKNYGNLYSSDSVYEWNKFFNKYGAGRIACWERI